MRFGAIAQQGTTFPYVKRDGARYVLKERPGEDVGALVGLSVEQLSEALRGAVPLTGEATALPPLRPPKIVAIGLNYMDHVREAGAEAPKTPLVFAKFPSSLAADGQAVTFDRALTARVDWEVELAVVIGAPARNVPVDAALSHVFGYTVANDLSARDLQAADGQWVRAKSLDGFCPLGPEVVTADEIADPQRLTLRTVVNGEVMQDSSTSEMVFGVAELIAFCSRSFTLEAGDVLLTGTPWGCGEFMTPRRSLQDGDVVTVSIASLGSLSNSIGVPRS
jgi:2-keto-4-pentenoate hydratase/2-oxohepta-3-ene-1,7-dioic acid hydratase in catechol pathway